MFGSKKKQSLGMTAATGLLVDPELRRAALRAAPPAARLGYLLGKRMAGQQARHQLTEARQQLSDAGEAFEHLATMLTSAGPQLAEQLGLIEPPQRKRSLAPALGGVAVVAVAVVLATDPTRRQKLQRLVIH